MVDFDSIEAVAPALDYDETTFAPALGISQWPPTKDDRRTLVEAGWRLPVVLRAVGVDGVPGPELFTSMPWEQDLIWTTAQGQLVPVAVLRPDHLDNIVAMLIRNAQNWYFRSIWDWSEGIQGDHALMEVEAMQEAAIDEFFDGDRQAIAQAWLEDTVLMRRLRSLQAQHSRRDDDEVIEVG